jgi:hypothetical protein
MSHDPETKLNLFILIGQADADQLLQVLRIAGSQQGAWPEEIMSRGVGEVLGRFRRSWREEPARCLAEGDQSEVSAKCLAGGDHIKVPARCRLGSWPEEITARFLDGGDQGEVLAGP